MFTVRFCPCLESLMRKPAGENQAAVRLLSSRGKPNIRIIWRLTVAFKWHHDMMLALPILAKFL